MSQVQARTEVNNSPLGAPAGATTYDPEAIARFRKESYMTGQNGNWDYASANTLRNSVNQAINMDGQFDRFKVNMINGGLKGGFFSHTHWNKSTFEKKDFRVAPELKKEDIPNGRPLFVREINKEVPPPDNYDIKRNTDIAPMNAKRPCLFGHSFQSYRRTCDIQNDIKVYDFGANCLNTEQQLPGMAQTKRRFPGYSMGKAKQFTLWDEEEKLSMVTPGPVSYNQDDTAIKMTRFKGAGIGYDVKANAKAIKLTPGAQDYEVQPFNSNSVIKHTHNYALQNGGVKTVKAGDAPKEQLITKSFNIGGSMIDGGSVYDTAGSAFGRGQDIIEKNKLAVKKGNMHSLMNHSAGAMSVEGYTKVGKYDENTSDMTHSMTNFSKNPKDGDVIMAQGPPKIPANLTTLNKRGRKGKLLPSLIDDSGVSPRGVNKLSSELSRFNRKGKGRLADSMQAGYETEATGQDHFRFHSTYDDGFGQHGGVFDSLNDGAFSTGHNPARVNYNQSQGIYAEKPPKGRKPVYKAKSFSTTSYGQKKGPNHKSFI